MDYVYDFWKPVVGVVLATGAIKLLINRRQKKKKKLPLDNYEDGIVYIHMFPRKFTKKCINLSPYAIKLETWCRLKKVPHQVVETTMFSPGESQIPWVVYNGEVLGDSSAIIQLLRSSFTVQDQISQVQCGVERAVSRMLDDCFSGVYFLYRYWLNIKDFQKYFQVTTAPFFMKWLIPRLIGKSVNRRSVLCGWGRYGYNHVVTLGERDLEALENLLGDQQYMFGDSPQTLDCTIFGHLSQIVYPDLHYPWKDYIHTHCPRLLAHTERMKERFWPEWDQLVDTDTFC